MPDKAEIDNVDPILIMRDRAWVRIKGRFLRSDSTVLVTGYRGGQPTGEVWEGSFLEGSLSPSDRNGKKGLVSAEARKTEKKGDDYGPTSTEIDITITNPGTSPTTSPQTPIPPAAEPET